MLKDKFTYQFKGQRYSSHTRILNLLKGVPAPARILEVGIAGGFMGEYLSGMGFEIIGIDKERSFWEEGKKSGYKEILIIDLNKEGLFISKPFDYILLADILEHLADPLGVLNSLKPLLKDCGRIIVSIPNVANWIIRLKLLFGRFEYQKCGILDRGHLRFFTLKTCCDMIQESGFRVKKFYSTAIPFQFFIRPRLLADCFHEIYYFLVKFYPKLFAYQFIFVLESVTDE